MISFETLTETLALATQWKGCDWITEFGPRKLNLCGLRSRQAALASNATRGEEAIAWNEAARWLGDLERDAARACDLANQAIDAARINEFASAIIWLREAESLEQRHHHLPGMYALLRERFEQLAEQQLEFASGDEESPELFKGQPNRRSSYEPSSPVCR